jgi:hypothetical protein
MFATYTADIEFMGDYMNVLNPIIIYGMGMGNVCAAASLINLGESCEKSGRIFLRDHLQFLSVNVTAPSSIQMKPMTGVIDQNHIFTHPSPIFSSILSAL